MEKHLLLIHVGPVQEFIATARRSRDLWFGSWLLSEMSKAAAKAVVEQRGAKLEDLIFPAPGRLDDLNPAPAEKVNQPFSELTVANKIVALVDKPPPPDRNDDPIWQAIEKRLDTIWQEVRARIENEVVSFDRTNAEKQIKDLPEYNWVVVPFLENEYVKNRKQAEALLAARKTTRNFKAVTWGNNCPKSSLDGIRESVIPEKYYPNRGDKDEIYNKKVDALYRKFKARAAERLSGVDLLKRNGQRGGEPGFPSTSHMAALPLMLHLGQLGQIKDVETPWNTYIEKLPEIAKRDEQVPSDFVTPIFGRWDGSLLFESRLGEYLKGDSLETACQNLCDFFAAVTDEEPLAPNPYYALLVADGDGMGKVIDAKESADEHRALSQVLNTFASGVKDIVEGKYKGSLVYAGGDDVLAFLPLHTALACTQELAANFYKQMQGFTYTDEKTKAEKSPTLSAGLAISHHIEPMSDALNLARNAEKKAKAIEGKNALAITVATRGGAPRTITGKWGELDERLTTFIKLHKQKAVPAGVAYQIREVALRLGEADLKHEHDDTEAEEKRKNNLQKALRIEVIRIFRRKQAEKGTKAVDKALLNQLTCLIMGRYLTATDVIEAEEYKIDCGQVTLPTKDITIEQLANELIIAGFFAKAVDQAGDDPQQKEVFHDNLDN